MSKEVVDVSPITGSSIPTPFTKTSNYLADDLSIHDGVPLPAHIPPPGQEGYRIPTVEDYQPHPQQGLQELRRRSSGYSSTFPLPPSGMHAGHNFPVENPNSNVNLQERMGWKQRVRYFTWAFFAMTMATGGIANVLASG